MSSEKKNDKAEFLKDENPRQGFRATESTTTDPDDNDGEENMPKTSRKGSDSAKTPLEVHPQKH